MRKIALMTGVAGALLFAGPVLAQDATPPTPTPPAAAPSQVSLSPGQTVRGPDGELGKLEGVRVDAQGQQELTVRGADGQLRAVPLGGLQVNGGEVSVAWSLEQYQAAPAIAGEAPAETETTPPAGDADSGTPPAPQSMPAEPPAENPDAPQETLPADPAQPDTATPAPDETPGT